MTDPKDMNDSDESTDEDTIDPEDGWQPSAFGGTDEDLGDSIADDQDDPYETVELSDADDEDDDSDEESDPFSTWEA